MERCCRLPRSRGLDGGRTTSHAQKTDGKSALSWRKRPVGVCCCLVPVQCRTEYRNLPKLSPSDCSLRVITAESRGLTLLRKARIRASPLGISWHIEYSPSIESDLDSGQLFVETVVLTSLVTVAGLRVSASPAVSGLTVVGHRSTLELQQAPVRIQQTTTSSHKWDKVSLAQHNRTTSETWISTESSSCHRSFGTLGTLLHKTA